MKLVRHPENPILPAVANTWMEDQTANPDLLRVGDSYHLYFRGQEGGHDRIGLGVVAACEFDGVHWQILPDPVIDVGAPGDWDETHVLDPATVLVDGKVYLYYSAVRPGCSRSVCLATSTDGVRFTKWEANPVAFGGGPEVVYREGTFYLYYWGPAPSSDGFALYGADFEIIGTEPVLPTGAPGEWDSHTVETPRIFQDRGLYYMVYCGSDRHDDYPDAAGLAVSDDLVNWRKYEDNPIFRRGEPGSWDEGAIWFATVERIGGRFYLWYEGYGGGTARVEPYGSYLTEGRSQIGLATLDAPYFFVSPTRAAGSSTDR